MTFKKSVLTTVLVGTLGVGGCMFGQTGKLLSAPFGTKQAAAQHNDEGIKAYDRGQLDSAKEHFEAAIKASPALAEAHYNLGMVLYKMGAKAEARPHFMRAADLAPGNAVIWSSPPLSSVQTLERSSKSPGSSDGHST